MKRLIVVTLVGLLGSALLVAQLVSASEQPRPAKPFELRPAKESTSGRAGMMRGGANDGPTTTSERPAPQSSSDHRAGATASDSASRSGGPTGTGSGSGEARDDDQAPSPSEDGDPDDDGLRDSPPGDD